jgi:3-oxoacyl-[acyl-carrier-protein] synthase-1
MVTPVGFTAAASCAAIRCGITGFEETRFMFGGEWLMGAEVPLAESWRGPEKLLRMIVPAIAECLDERAGARPESTALLLCLAEPDRPGRLPSDDEGFLRQIQSFFEPGFHEASCVFPEGRTGGVHALEWASELIDRKLISHCIVAGVDSLLVAPALTALAAGRRLQTAENSDGLLPGEAGAAVLIGPTAGGASAVLTCLGAGIGHEPSAEASEAPLRGDGLTEAFRKVLDDAGVGWEAIDYRITDIAGEQLRFKEAALALTRCLRQRKEFFDLWHPADCTGDVGAAIVPLALGVGMAAARRGYAPGPGLLCHFSGDGAVRAAVVLRPPDSRAA